MSFQLVFILLALSGLGGIALGYILRLLISLGQRGSIDIDIKGRLLEARERADRIVKEAEKQAEEVELTRSAPLREREGRLDRMNARILKREEFLDEREKSLSAREEAASRSKSEAETVLQERQAELARIAHFSEEEARARLFEEVERAQEHSLMARIQKLEANGRKQLEEKARSILLTTIHRLSNPVNADAMTLSIQLSSEEVKGKIIGKDGRNIKAFERATGADLIVDEAPDRITVSSFDPLRRHIAKAALEKLIEDGRIQPARIEDTVQKVRSGAESLMKEKGQQAAYDAGVVGLDPRLTALLGRLHFRTSYGQNVLTHSIEMSHIASMLAEELGADPAVARAGALLHDIGKAVDHEVSGTHVEIGRRILEKFGVDQKVIQAMQSHHEEYEFETPESIIVQVADAISAGRPGARRDTLERYMERLSDLERLAMSFPGVEKAYAISAGREIRIFVNPGKISDLAAHDLARKIALRIQEEIKHPGEIKVNVIRENRVVEFAR